MDWGDDDINLREVIAANIPTCVRRLLDVGCGGELGAQLKLLRPVIVAGVEPDAGITSEAKGVLDGVFASVDEAVLSDARFDCVYIPNFNSVEAYCATMGTLLPALDSFGFFLAFVPNPKYGRGREATETPSPDALDAAVAPLGLVPYIRWNIDTPDSVAGVTSTPSNTTHEQRPPICFLLWFARADYNPVNHAREQLQQGRAAAAYQLLLYIPDTYLQDDEVAAAVAAEKLLCLLVMARREDYQSRLARFSRAQYYFYEATARVPGHPVAFECQERFWRLLGDTHMAECMRAIYHQVQLSEHIATRAHAPAAVDIVMPDANRQHAPRVLLLTHEMPDFGLDILYDGLCRAIGEDHVTEFPWKKSLHGQAPDLMAHYPCTFDYPGTPHTASEILKRAAAGEFDVILCGALQPWLDTEFMRQLAAAAPTVPWALVDQRDEPNDPRHEFTERLPHTRLAAFFKREWLHCAAFEGPVYPLPFAYPDHLIPPTVETTRSRAVFWAGHGWAGMRRAYLEHLANTLGMVFPERLAQEEYRAALLESRIGLNFFGFGFDTVRYWELPAHGCMLLANRLPIRIPYNFKDGISAVFFDDLLDLEEKLRYYLAHDDEAAAIAHAGRECLIEHHTSTARARQLLGALAPHAAR